MKYFWTMILAVALAGTVSAAPKKTKAAAKEPAKPALETKLNASLALTDGNSETLAENVSLVMEGEKEGLGSVLASIENNYGESQVEGVKDTTVNNVAAALNLKKTLSPRTFASVDGSALHDQVASISYRALVGSRAWLLFRQERQARAFARSRSFLSVGKSGRGARRLPDVARDAAVFLPNHSDRQAD